MIKEFRILSWVFFWIIFIIISFEILLNAGYPWKYSRLEPFLLRYNNDSWTHNAFEIERIKKAVSLKNYEQVIIYMGGSVALASITSDDKMSQILSERMNRKILFTSLCSSYKTFSDEIKIVEELGEVNVTIILNSEILRFKTTNDKQLVNYLEDAKHEHLKYYFLPTSTETRFILEQDNFEIGFKHRVRFIRSAMVFGEILKTKVCRFFFARQRFALSYHRHIVGDFKPVDAKQQAVLSKKLASMLRNIEKVYGVNCNLFEVAIDKARANGNRVILAESPVNPLFVDQMEVFAPKYNKLIQGLVQKKDLTYLDLRGAAGWVPEDFRDLHHMLPSGREKFTPILAEKLALLNLLR